MKLFAFLIAVFLAYGMGFNAGFNRGELVTLQFHSSCKQLTPVNN